MNPYDIARVCHEVNAAYCRALGDESQPSWEAAPEWQRMSAFAGVQFHLESDREPSASHNEWMRVKEADGWTFGEVKDPEAKTHPCMVPFDSLPVEQKAKDYIFKAIVDALK